MARRYRNWTKEQKFEIIKPVMNCEITQNQQAKKYEISLENIFKWIKRYKENRKRIIKKQQITELNS